MDVLNWAWASVTVFGECAMRCIALYGFDYIIPINVKVNLLTFWLISFRMWNCPRCMHIHAADSWADPSVTMHRVVHILFVLCLVPVPEQLASIGPPAENFSKLNAIHSMRRDAGRGKPDDRNSCHCHWASNAPMWKRVWIAGRHGPTLQKQVVCWDTMCRSQELQVHVIHRTRWSLRWDSSPTWYPRCVTHTCFFLAQKTLASPAENIENGALIAINKKTFIIVS